MTVLVRDEADIVGEQIRYHLERGVDHVVVTDHGSVDGTEAILRKLERSGRLTMIAERGEFAQSEWVTRMARFAAEELGADWVINADADEFWWPRHGPLEETLAAVPAHFGVVRALQRHFVARPGPGPFSERMIFRHAAVDSLAHLFHAQVKVVHRAVPDVFVPRGNHDAYGAGLRLLREWFPFEVLHFPVRTLAQFESKFSRRRDRPAPFVETIRREIAAYGAERAFARYGADESRLATDIGAGRLSVDVRLRDALRAGGDVSGVEPERLPPETPTAAERAFVADVGAFVESDSARLLPARTGRLSATLAAVAASLGR